MAIKVEVSESRPSLDYNYIHLEELTITQDRLVDINTHPYYELMVTYRLYAICEDGKIEYSNKPTIINIKDYLTVAENKYQTGDPRLILALQAIESGLSGIISDSGKHGTTEVL